MHGRDLGLRLRRARERARLTQRELAERVGVDRKTVGNWESGVSSPRSSLGRLEAVLKDYGFSLDADPWPPPASADAVIRMIVEVLDSAFSPAVQVQMIRDIIEREYDGRSAMRDQPSGKSGSTNS
ncbi:MAG TPA: helix-turn-helix transcriptional regulator [Natronosporangium sp.]